MPGPRLGNPRRITPVRRPWYLSPAPPPTPSRVAVTREYPPDKLALKIQSATGQKARWAEDETNPENVLADAEITTEIPGGYKDMSLTLGRDPQVDWHDMEAYSDAYAYQPGVSKVFEGSLDKAPTDTGDEKTVTPQLLGYQAVLEDNQAAQVGFIDCDLSKWSDPSLQEKVNLNAANRQQIAAVSTGFQDAGATLPGIIFEFMGVDKIEGQGPGNVVCYYGGGVDIGRVFFNQFGDTTPAWEKYLIISKDDVRSSQDLSPNYSGIASNENQGPQATVAGRKYAMFYVFYLGAGTFTMTNRQIFNAVKVIGKHGLTIQGTWPNIGFIVKQMLPYLINNFAQPLTCSEADVDDDGFLITQAWYGDGGPVADVMKDILKYGLLDWFVYRGKKVEYRKPGSYGRFWKTTVAPSRLSEVGLDSQRLWRSIVVSYTDVDGSTRTVGPPGSGCRIENAALGITDPEHPAVKANRTRKDMLDLQGIGTPASAIEVGKRFLEEANLIDNSGSATLSGFVMDQYGVFWPAACVKAGDWISFTDASDRGYRKIINTAYRHSERSNEIDIDAPASGLEALLERLQAGLISLGVS